MASVEQIVDRLHNYYEARDTVKSLKIELMKLCVECGQDQKDTIEGNPVNYLDGYLAGVGVLRQARRNK